MIATVSPRRIVSTAMQFAPLEISLFCVVAAFCSLTRYGVTEESRQYVHSVCCVGDQLILCMLRPFGAGLQADSGRWYLLYIRTENKYMYICMYIDFYTILYIS